MHVVSINQLVYIDSQGIHLPYIDTKQLILTVKLM